MAANGQRDTRTVDADRGVFSEMEGGKSCTIRVVRYVRVKMDWTSARRTEYWSSFVNEKKTDW